MQGAYVRKTHDENDNLNECFISGRLKKTVKMTNLHIDGNQIPKPLF